MMQKKNEKDQRTPSQSSGPKAFGPGPFIPSEKPKNFKKTFWRLLKYLNPRKKMLIIVVIASLLATLFNVISPKLLGDATSSIFESFIAGSGVDFDFLGNLLLILILLYTSSSIFSWLQHYLIAGVSQMTIAELRQEVNEKLSRLPLRYLDKHAHGDVLSRAVNDIDNIQTSLQQSLTQMITSIFTIIGVIVMMLIISPIMTLVVLLMLPLSGLIVKKVVSFSQRHFVNQQNELGRVNGHVEEMFSGHQVVKAFGYEQEAIKKFDDINDRLYKAGWKAQFVSGIMMPLMSFVGNLGFVMISIVGGLFVINGNLRIGDVQAFIQYSQQFSHPMAHLAGIANLIQSAIASAERIFALLDEEEEKKEQAAEVELTKLQGHVSIRNVSFSYDKKTPILKNMSLDVKEGDTVAIVGPTGAGKTTIINLLMRFYELDRGSIHIDGINLEQFSREQVRSMIAMVLQDTWLFNGTIRDNIAYGREGVTKEEVIAAAKSAFADDFIRTLPDGYDTVLGEDASNISQGQKQLLTIARAIISNPKILILDEATSSVDTRTEKNIQKAMKKLMEGRTSFVIAHRLSTIQDADVILVMNQGEILEKGTHHELLNKNGFYAELYYSQFSKKAEVS